MKKIHHLSHTDLDGYSAQVIMGYTPHKKQYIMQTMVQK